MTTFYYALDREIPGCLPPHPQLRGSPQTVAKLANGYNLFHLGYQSLKRVAMFLSLLYCTTYSFSELQSQQYSQDGYNITVDTGL